MPIGSNVLVEPVARFDPKIVTMCGGREPGGGLNVEYGELGSSEMARLTADEFVASLHPDDPHADHRRWTRMVLYGSVERVTDELLAAAFQALEAWSSTASTETQREWQMAGLGVTNVLHQAIVERPDSGTAIASRLARLATCPNVDVASITMSAFRRAPQYLPVALPRIETVAASDSDHPHSTPITLRGLAFRILYDSDETVASRPEFRAARLECARALFAWGTETSTTAEELTFTANRLLWFG